MKIPKKQHSGKLERKNSAFFSYLFPIETKEAVEKQLHTLREQHPKANHIVYAYRIGQEPRTSSGFSDAGEPKGTAGKPLFDLIGYKELTNVLIAVVRYFGGIKLGTGGLVKAYTESGQLALENVPLKEFRSMQRIRLRTEYHFFEPVKKHLEENNISIDKEEFTTDVLLNCRVGDAEVKQLKQELCELTNGTIVID